MPPGWTAAARTPRGAVALVERDREQDVGGFRAPVGHEGAVRRAFETGIVEIDVGKAVPGGGKTHQSRAVAHQRRDAVDQYEMAKVVGTELRLEAVGCSAEGRSHHARIGDDEVERLGLRVERVGAGAHAGQGGEVELDQREGAASCPSRVAHPRGRALCLSKVARCADHIRAAGREGTRGFDPQTCRNAGHQSPLAAQTDPGKHVVGRAGRSKLMCHVASSLCGWRSGGVGHARLPSLQKPPVSAITGGSLREHTENFSVYNGCDVTGEPKEAGNRRLRADAQRNRDHLLEVAKTAFRRGGADLNLDDLAKEAGVGVGTVYRHFPTRDALIEAVYRNEVQTLAEAATLLADIHPPLDALRSWMRLFVDYIATKHLIAPALNSIVGGPSHLYAATGDQMKRAINSLVGRAVASGDIRPDLDPFDLLRALVGVANVAATPDWEASAKRLVDILIAGSRPIA